jgi:hypothetical protein
MSAPEPKADAVGRRAKANARANWQTVKVIGQVKEAMLQRMLRAGLGVLGLIGCLFAWAASSNLALAESEPPFKPVLVMLQTCGMCMNFQPDSNAELLLVMGEDGRLFRQEVGANGPFDTWRPQFKTMRLTPTERDALLSEVRAGLSGFPEQPNIQIDDAPVFAIGLPLGEPNTLLRRYDNVLSNEAWREPSLGALADRLLSIRRTDEEAWRPQTLRLRVIARGKADSTDIRRSVPWPALLTKPSSDNAVVCMALSSEGEFKRQTGNKDLLFDDKIWWVRSQWIDLPFGAIPDEVIPWSSDRKPLTVDC